jgi:hypothetical protein
MIIPENYRCGKKTIRQTLDLNVLGPLIEHYCSVFADAANIFITPLMNVEVSVTTFGWPRYDGKLN